MELAKYKAVICEGTAEEAIMDILLDNERLIFKREEILEEEVIRCREGKKFEQKYLRKGFLEKISSNFKNTQGRIYFNGFIKAVIELQLRKVLRF